MAIISRIPHSIIFCFLVILLCGSITPVYSQTAEPETAQQKIAYSETVIDEVKKSLQRLEDKERQNYERELEGQHKRIDTLLTILTILIGMVGFIGILAPIILVRKERELIKLEIKSIQDMKKEAADATDEIKKKRNELESLKGFSSGDKDITAAESEKYEESAEKINNDPQFDPRPGLRAAAIEASLKNQPEKAYKLWETLAELDSSDIYALYNSGYWELQLAKDSVSSEEALKWSMQASKRFEQVISTKPDFYEAVINGGIALDLQAVVFASSDFPRAHSLWRLACEKYQQALSIKPDSHEAANNWGNALAKEAKELAKSNLFAARELWHEAGAKYKQALSLKPDSHDAENNWGSALSQEAQELAKSDLVAASKLWQEANEKFQRALSIKPDFHVAIDNWGGSSLNEANAIAATDSDKANELRNRAKRLLLPLAQSAPELVAYNLACVHGQRGDVSSCLHWLKTAHAHNKLVSCEHLQTDADLRAVRDHPDFQAWLQSICPR